MSASMFPLDANRALSRNLTFAMSAYSASTPCGRRFDISGFTLVDSGLEYGAFNSAILPEGARLQEADARLGEASRYFRSVGRPWGFWVCDDLASEIGRPSLHRLATRHRLMLSDEHQGMIADRLTPPRRVLPEADFVAADDPSTQQDFADVCAHVFAVPRDVAFGVYASASYWRAGLRGWVAYQRRRPVAIAATASAGGVIGVYSVGTILSCQHRGYGEAITRYAVQAASHTTARTQIILQSTPAGFPLYRRMGFVPVSPVSVYLSG